MKIKEILNFEKRKDDDLTKAFLLKEGDWWRAYEWSAYLLTEYTKVNSKELNVTKKSTKEDGEYVFVGLKMAHFANFLPDLRDNENFIIEENKITIDLSEFFKDEDFRDYENILVQWKEKFKMKAKKVLSRGDNLNDDNSVEECEIINMLKEYPLADKTLIENTNFIGLLQRLCKKLNK